MTAGSKFEMIYPPNRLAAKVAPGGPDLETVVAEAEAALAGMDGDYREWIRDDLVGLGEAVAAARRAPETAAEQVKRIYGVAHNIKGQGATFDYPLLTQVAQSLCVLIVSDEANAAERLDLIAFHIDALKVVVKNDIRGPGGTQGRELVAKLSTAVEKALAA